MRRNLFLGALIFGAAMASSAAAAKEYKDYTYGKGVWQITAVEVDPNHVDDYLTGLRKSQAPAFDVMKRHGIIDEYHFAIRQGYSKGSPNVLIEVHFTSAAMLEPDQARDTMIENEIVAGFSEEAGKVAVAGYEKYRQFLDVGQWSEVLIAK